MRVVQPLLGSVGDPSSYRVVEYLYVLLTDFYRLASPRAGVVLWKGKKP